MAHHEIDLLLSCRDIIIEPLEAAVFIPHVDEVRMCKRHGEQKIIKVGAPYWVDEKVVEIDKAKGQ